MKTFITIMVTPETKARLEQYRAERTAGGRTRLTYDGAVAELLDLVERKERNDPGTDSP